jgi:hypothetical protein
MVSKAVKAQLEVLQDLGLHLRASPLVDGLGTPSVSRCGCNIYRARARNKPVRESSHLNEILMIEK